MGRYKCNQTKLNLIKMRIRFLLIFLLFFSLCHAQKISHIGLQLPFRPKLVIGIVVDQMRYDYLYRYYDKYCTDGFRKLMQGVNCTYTQYNYAPTYTGPGHASIYTGTTPAFHGIAGNNWYDRHAKKVVYCSNDTSVNTVGDTSAVGKMSPRLLLTTAITDELHLYNDESKIFGLALKDRGAILPAGHAADAAYWFNGNNGTWVSSTWYMDDLPQWLTNYNASQPAAKFLKQNWNTILPLHHYHESAADSLPYEGLSPNETAPIFPHKISEIQNLTPNDLRATPFGNTLTLDMAIQLITHESLGNDAITDFLAISLSSPDYIGHKYGPQSIEVEDNYIRLDLELAQFLRDIDTRVGLENTLIFLTADHGAAEVPAYFLDNKIPAGVVLSDDYIKLCKQFFISNYQDSSLYLYYDNQQIYLDRDKIAKRNLDYQKICKELAQLFAHRPEIYRCLPVFELQQIHTDMSILNAVRNGIHPTRSGDVVIILQPAWFEDMLKGTTHGSTYNYDTHVPLLWYGWKIPTLNIYEPIMITDIAPTLAQLLHIQEPNACTGKPIVKLLERIKW